MNYFKNGAHEGDEISNMENSDIMYLLLILDKEKSEIPDTNIQFKEEIINEIDYRIRANTFNIEKDSNLKFIINTQSHILYTTIFELGSDYASSIVQKSLVFIENIDKEKAIDFLTLYLEYYKKIYTKAPEAFKNILNELENTDYEKLIMYYLPYYLYTNPSTALLIKENFITKEIVIDFLLKDKFETYFKNINTVQGFRYLVSKIDIKYVENLQNASNILKKNIYFASSLDKVILENNSIWDKKNLFSILDSLNNENINPDELFQLLPKKITEDLECIEKFFTTFKNANPECIPVKFLNNYDFLSTFLLINRNIKHLDYFFNNFKEDKKTDLMIYFIDVFDTLYRYNCLDNYDEKKFLIKTFKDKFPKVDLGDNYNLVSDNAYSYLTHLNIFSKYLMNSDVKIENLIKIFEAMYLNLKQEKITDYIYDFFKNNLFETYENNEYNHNINFLQLTLLSDMPNLEYLKLEKLMQKQLLNIYEKNKAESSINIAGYISLYLNVYSHPDKQLKDFIFLSILKVLPSEILNTIKEQYLFSPSYFHTIVDKNGNKVNDDTFYSTLNTLSFEYELEQTVPIKNIPIKKIKF